MACLVNVQTLCHKRGDTLLLTCVKKKDGVPDDITGWDIQCGGRTTTGTIFSTGIGTGITIMDATAGEYQIRVDDTTAFEIGNMEVDIQYTEAGIIFSTETFIIDILEDITI